MLASLEAPIMKVYFSFTLLILSIVIIYSCSENVSAPENSRHGNQDDQVNATISISPQFMKTFVGDSIMFTSDISKEPDDIILKQNWEIQPSGVATVDSSGMVKINDLGKATLTTLLYDEKDSLLASDTAQLFSEARLVLETESKINALTEISDQNGIFAVGKSPDNLAVSYDNGTTWQKKSSIPSKFDISRVARSKTYPDSIIISYDDTDANGSNEYTTGLLLSTDNADTWTELSHPFKRPTEEIFYNFSTLSILNNYMFVLTEVYSNSGGIRLYKSSDAGKTWIPKPFVNSGSSGIPNLLLDPSNSQNMYVSFRNGLTFSGVYVSLNQGDTWKLWENSYRVFDIGADGTLYGYRFAGESTGSNEQIIYSSDNAEKWNIIFEEEDLRTMDIDSFGSRVLAVLLMNDTNAGHVIKYSVDNGENWQVYTLAFNDQKTFNRPTKVKVLNVDEESVELLSIWTDLHPRGESQIWKHRIYHNLED